MKQCDMCHEYYWVEDLIKLGNYIICRECIDFIDQDLECKVEED